MSTLSIASNEADAQAATAIEQHHAELVGSLGVRADAVSSAAERGSLAEVKDAVEALVTWCETELVPHAQAEEETLYAAARDLPEGRLLIEGMVSEHAVLLQLIREIAAAPTSLVALADSRALRILFENHAQKENTLVIPLLVSAPGVSLAGMLEGMHSSLQRHAPVADDALEAPRTNEHGHTCTCGESDDPGYPELDARAVPHAIRHATIFGALDGVRPQGGLVLVAPHDPKPLLAQVEQRDPGKFSVEYLERGPEAWRLAFVRQDA